MLQDGVASDMTSNELYLLRSHEGLEICLDCLVRILPKQREPDRFLPDKSLRRVFDENIDNRRERQRHLVSAHHVETRKRRKEEEQLQIRLGEEKTQARKHNALF